MRLLAGILLIVFGAAYPMAAVFWLNGRMRRVPALLPRQVTVILAFNGIFPLLLIGLGAALLSARLWASGPFKLALVMVGLVSLALLVIGWRQAVGQRQAAERLKEMDDGRGATSAGL